jgi:NADH-quinone oxidoreductase subunit F
MLERIDSGEATPMDLDIMASVQEQIIGNCLCVLGDAMAMPIGSMIKHFRDEFEAYIEEKREQNGLGAAIPQVNRGRQAGAFPMREPADVDPTAAVV